MYIKVIDVFSNVPGGRYIEEGPYSGEEFRAKILVPAVTKCIDQNEILTIDFDGAYGYGSGFLEESFGGLVRLGFDYNILLNMLEFISHEDPKIIKKIYNYIKEEGLRQQNSFKLKLDIK